MIEVGDDGEAVVVLVCFQEREGVGIEFPGGGVGVVGEELLEVAVEFRARGELSDLRDELFPPLFLDFVAVARGGVVGRLGLLEGLSKGVFYGFGL